MENQSRKKLYSALSSQFDLGSYEEFNAKMDNPESRKKLYGAVSNSFDLGSYEEFESKVASASQEQTLQAEPQAEVQKPQVKKKEQGSKTLDDLQGSYGKSFSQTDVGGFKEEIKPTTPQGKPQLITPPNKIVKPSDLRGEFENRVSALDSKIAERTEEYAVPELNYLFGEYGFKFEEYMPGADMVKVTAPNGSVKKIQLDAFTDKGALANNKELKSFIESNKPSTYILSAIEKKTSPNIPKFTDEKQLEKVSTDVSTKAASLVNDAKAFKQAQTALENDVKEIENVFIPDLQKQIANGSITLEQANTLLADKRKNIELQEQQLKVFASDISQRQSVIEKNIKQLDKATGEYLMMKGEQGTWYGAVRNAFIEGYSRIGAGSMDIGLDVLANVLPKDEKAIQQKSIAIAREKLFRDKPNLTDEQVLSSMSEEQRKEIESVAEDRLLKRLKFGDKTKEGSEGIGLISEGKKAMKEVFKTMNTTEAYEALSKENFVYSALLGVVESAPAMMSMTGKNKVLKSAQTIAQFYAQGVDMINDEMNDNPAFDEISENEKLLVKAPVGIAVAVLENYGLRNVIANKGLLNSVILKALGKAGMKTSAKTFAELVENEIESAVARGVLTITSAGLAEFETGATQAATEIAIKEIYNNVKGKEMFETPDSFLEFTQDVLKDGVAELIGGVAMGTPSAISSAVSSNSIKRLSNEQFEVFNALALDDNMYNVVISDLKNKVLKGEITEEQAKTIRNQYDVAVGGMRSLPNDMSVADKKEALELVLRKKQLEQQIEGKDPDLVQYQKREIERISNKLQEISNKQGGQDAVQISETAEVDAREQAGDSEGVGAEVSEQAEVRQDKGIEAAGQEEIERGKAEIESSDKYYQNILKDETKEEWQKEIANKYFNNKRKFFEDNIEYEKSRQDEGSGSDASMRRIRDADAALKALDQLEGKTAKEEITATEQADVSEMEITPELAAQMEAKAQEIESSAVDVESEVAELEQVTATEEVAEVPELKDVESTAKALEGAELMNLKIEPNTPSLDDLLKDGRTISGGSGITIQIEKQPNKFILKYSDGRVSVVPLKSDGSIFDNVIENLDYLRYANEVKQTPQSISEAYHKAKEDGSNPELVKAVESLLVKEKPKAEAPKPKAKSKRQPKAVSSAVDKLAAKLEAKAKKPAKEKAEPSKLTKSQFMSKAKVVIKGDMAQVKLGNEVVFQQPKNQINRLERAWKQYRQSQLTPEQIKREKNKFAENIRKKYSAVDVVTVERAILMFFAMGGKLNQEQALKLTGYKNANDLPLMVSKDGSTIHGLMEQVADTLGRPLEEIEDEFNRQLDNVLQGGIGGVHSTLNDIIREERGDDRVPPSDAELIELGIDRLTAEQQGLVELGEEFLVNSLTSEEVAELDAIIAEELSEREQEIKNPFADFEDMENDIFGEAEEQTIKQDGKQETKPVREDGEIGTETKEGSETSPTDTRKDEAKREGEQKSLADKIRNLKAGDNRAFDATIGIPVAVYNGAVELVATSVEAGIKLGNAIAKAMKYIDSKMGGKKWNKGLFAKEMNVRYSVTLPNGSRVEVERDITAETAEVINGWYQPIEQKILDAKTETKPANKWAEYLRSKEDEDLWTGVRAFLESKGTQSVTKKELQDFIKNNRVEIVEVVKNSPKFSEYQLKGEKENYKELLVALPSQNERLLVDIEVYYDTVYNKNKKKKPFDDLLENQYYKVEEAWANWQQETNKQQYKSSHFDEPNILVHLRMNTRTDADGYKVLFLEELQSDWGQEGKKIGFKQSDKKTRVNKNDYYAQRVVGNVGFIDIINKNTGQISQSYRVADVKDENGALDTFVREREYVGQQKKTPTAPFVTSTPSWVKLGIKTAIKEAVNQGATKIAWTTGEQQNKRYDLSKQVDYIQHEEGFNNTKYVDISTPSGLITFQVDSNGKILENKNQQVPESIGKNLSDVIGKDITDRILSTKKGGRIEGEGLKVGGSGMKGFYDKIVPDVAKAVVKELTGQEGVISQVDISTNKYLSKLESEKRFNAGETLFVETKDGGEKQVDSLIDIDDAFNNNDKVFSESELTEPSIQQSIEITPELKASVQAGIPLFGTAKAKAELAAAKKAFDNKLKSGLQSGGLAALPEFARLVKAYAKVGILTAQDFLKRFKEDFKDTTFSDKDIVGAYKSVSANLQKEEALKQKVKDVREQKNQQIEDIKRSYMDRIKQIRANVKNAKETREELTKFISENITKDNGFTDTDIKRLNSLINKVTPKNYIAALDRASKLLDAHREKLKGRVIKQVYNEAVKNAKVTTTASGRKRSDKLTAEDQSFMKEAAMLLKAILNKNTQALLKIADSINAIKMQPILFKQSLSEPLTAEEKRLLDRLAAFELLGDIENMTLEEVQDILKDMKEAFKQGRQKLIAKKAAKAQEKQIVQNKAATQIQQRAKSLYVVNEDGETVLKDPDQIAATRISIRKSFKEGGFSQGVQAALEKLRFSTMRSGVRSITRSIAILDTLTNALDNPVLGLNFFRDNVYKLLARGDSKEIVVKETLQKAMDDIAKKIFGSKSDYKKVLKLLRGEPIPIRLYSNISKSYTDVYIDRDIAMKVLAWSLNPDTNLLLQNQNIGQTTIDLIKSVLGDKLVRFAEETVAYLSSENYEQVNKVYSELNNRYLPQIENYFPRRSAVKLGTKEIMDGDLESLYSAMNQSFLNDRSKVADLKILGAGFSDILDEHFNGVAKYLAYAEIIQKLNNVFASPDVNAFLSEIGLKSLYKSSVIFSINPESKRDSSLDNTITSALQSISTVVTLGLKPIQVVKQSISFLNEFPDYNVFKNRPMFIVDFPAFLIEYAIKSKGGLDIKTFKRMYDLSPSFRNRVRGYMSGDLTRLESGINKSKRSVTERLKESKFGRTKIGGREIGEFIGKNSPTGDIDRMYKTALNAFTSLGDANAVIAALVVYDRNVANGMPHEQALEIMEEYNTRQQSLRAMDKSALQRNANFVSRYLLMYASAPLLQLNKTMSAGTNIMRSIFAGKPPRAYDVRTFYINYAVANILFTLANNMFKLWDGDDEDVEEVMEELKMAALGINTLQNIPILGAKITQAWYWLNDINREAKPGVDFLAKWERQYNEARKEGKGEIRALLRPSIELATKLNTDPFVGMYKGYTGESNADDLLYDLIGVSKSARPWSYDVKKDKSMKEEDPETGEDVIKDEQEYSELSRRSSGAWYDKNQEELEKRREKREEEKENQ